jgi:cytochrome oxidase Cu insertion factor (SCO1/SenC/PrrC family)
MGDLGKEQPLRIKVGYADVHCELAYSATMDQIPVSQQRSAQAPAFHLLSNKGDWVELSQFKGHWLVLYFCVYYFS